MIPPPVEMVTEELAKGGYVTRSRSLCVMGIDFDFAAVLSPPEQQADLVIVVDSAAETPEAISGKVLALGRALDAMSSPQQLTVVVVGPKPPSATISIMSKVARVLPVGSLLSEKDHDQLKRWLAVLMPLQLPHASQTPMDPLSLILEVPEAKKAGTLAIDLICAARNGRSAVESTLINALAAQFTEQTKKLD